MQILFRLRGFSTNFRKEITKSAKWYFFDNGIRNALINDFRLVPTRQDLGLLWENYCIYERMKLNNNLQIEAAYYFWRTYDQQEIDLIEKTGTDIKAFEFKFGNGNKKIPAFFAKNYHEAPYSIINRENYLDFILAKSYLPSE